LFWVLFSQGPKQEHCGEQEIRKYDHCTLKRINGYRTYYHSTLREIGHQQEAEHHGHKGSVT